MNQLDQRKPGATGTCLDDQQLRVLLDDAPAQPEWITHLDECHRCQRRLETVTADREQWDTIRDHLHGGTAPRFRESTCLSAAIESLCEPTDAVVRSRSRSRKNIDASNTEMPDSIGPYQVISQVGRGGMGVVYEAFDTSLQRRVAIKRITESLRQRPGSATQFRQEARAVAAIQDPNVVAIHAIEESGTYPYIVMEFVDGISLADKLQQDGRLAWRDVARIGAETASGLAAAHAAGVVHRDIKPANLLIDKETGRIKISDFGLAHPLANSGVHESNVVHGTPEFISPEQAAGQAVDHRADLFSLGSVLYAACTGRAPFEAENTNAVLQRTREDQPTPIRETCKEIPAALTGVIDKLMSKDPDQRYSTSAEVAKVLSQLSNEATPIAAPPFKRTFTTRYALVAAALSLVLMVAGFGGLYAGTVSLSEEAPENAAADQVAVADNAGQRKGGQRKKKKAQQGNGANVVQPAEAEAPLQRVQLVKPDDLLRERIRKEKDNLQKPRHPSLLSEFKGHTGPVNALAITPDSKLIVSASGWPTGDRSVRVWNASSGKMLRKFDTSAMPQNPGDSGQREAPGEIFTVAVTPDGEHAITGSTGGAVCVWSIATGKLLREFKEHTATVYDVAISSNGDVALTGGRDGVARLWRISTGEELMQLKGHKSWIRCVAISPDGKRALTGSYDKTMRLWDLEEAKLLREFKTQRNWIWDIDFSPSGKIAACVSGSSVQLWDLESGKVVRSLKGGDNGTSVDISPDGRLAIGGSYDGKVRVWDVSTGELLTTYTGHRDWVWSTKFSPDGAYALSGGGGRHTATGGSSPGIDFAIRKWKLPKTEPRIAKPQ